MEIKNYFAQDGAGNLIAAATCSLYLKDTQTLATVYDKNGIQTTNPFYSDGTGLIQFAAAAGLYDLKVTANGRTYTIVVQCVDIAEQVAEVNASKDQAAASATAASGSSASAATSASVSESHSLAASSSAVMAAASEAGALAAKLDAQAAATYVTASADEALASKVAAESAAAAALVSEQNAAADAAQVAADKVEIRNHYYGPLAADPALRPDGSSMAAGDEYHNTATGKRRVFTGTGWEDFLGASTADLANATDPAKGAGMVGRAIRNINSISELQGVSGKYDGETVRVISYYDGWAIYAVPRNLGGGLFVWDASSVATQDLGSVVEATGVATGRWVRQFDADPDAYQWGARGDESADDIDPIQRLMNYVASTGGGVARLLGGSYTIGSTLFHPSGVRLVGAGATQTTMKPTAAFRAAMQDAGGPGYSLIVNYGFNVDGQPEYGSAFDLSVEHIRFVFDTTTSTGVSWHKNNCIFWNNAKRLRLANCTFYGWGQHAVDISGCRDAVVEWNSCFNGFWSAIQIDQAGGGYGASTTRSQRSLNVVVKNNYLEGFQSTYGAIQIHKDGGSGVDIDGNSLVNCRAGICTDDYFAESFSPIGKSSRIKIRNNTVISNVALSVGIRIAKELSEVEVSSNVVSVLGEALRTGGGAAGTWQTDVIIEGNYLSGSTSRLVGMRRARVKDNHFICASSKIRVALDNFWIHNNAIEGYGLNIEPVVETDVRNSTNYTYRNAQGDFDLNSFFNPAAGETVSYRVVTDGFVQLTFNTKDYFAFATAFDLTGLNTTNGVVIRDQFRGTLRTTTGISTNLLPGMFWYNSTKKRIEAYDGTTTYDALGTRTASVSYNPPLLAAGASGPEQSTTISGVALGDHVTAAFNQNLLGLMVVAWVSAADTVNWYFHNPVGNPNGSQDLPTGNVSFRVVRP